MTVITTQRDMTHVEDKLYALMGLMDVDFIDLKYAIEDNHIDKPYNLKRIKAYLDTWYGDLPFISIEGIRYYVHNSQFVHALLDALVLADTEGEVCH